MRSDMFKVIVERPRKWKDPKNRAERRRNDFDGPCFLGMRAGLGRPALNENLNPLKRYLHAQVGRPWNKVFAEIAARIDRRNTVQQHVYQHIDDYIAVQVAWRSGDLVDLKQPWPSYRTGRPELLQPLYVDPRSGLIRPNKRYRTWSAEWRAWKKATDEANLRQRRQLDASTLLMRLEDEWYEVRVASYPWDDSVTVFDVVLKCELHSRDPCMDERKKLYGGWDTYAVSKRQLSRREIERYELPR